MRVGSESRHPAHSDCWRESVPEGVCLARLSLSSIVAEGSGLDLSVRITSLESWSAGGESPPNGGKEEKRRRAVTAEEAGERCWQDGFLANNINTMGFFAPLVVVQGGGASCEESRYLLLDGYRRFEVLRHSHARRDGACCVVLPHGVPKLQLFLFLAWEHRGYLKASVVARSFLIQMALDAGVGRQEVVGSLLPAMGLAPSGDMLHRYMAILDMPYAALAFCHQKALSARRVLHMSLYPRELLEWLFGQVGRLHLTASVAEEILDGIREVCERRGVSLSALLAGEPELAQVLEGANLQPSERTKLLRQVVSRLRRPVSSRINKELSDVARRAEALLPGMRVSWDQSLESDRITVTFDVSDEERLTAIWKAFGQSELRQTFSAMRRCLTF